MFSLQDLVDQQAEKEKKRKTFDLSIIVDTLPKALNSLDETLYTAFQTGRITPQKVVGKSRRVLYLGVDSAIALPMSYHKASLLSAMNKELDDFAIDDILLVHLLTEGKS